MGTWGPGIYQDDIAEDIRDEYKDKLHRGKTGEEITQMLIEEYGDSLYDIDDAPVFWFALADTQWNLGRLENSVKEKALYFLDEGSNLKRWENENPRLAKKRKAVLDSLKEKLLSKQPEEKKISQYKLYHCEWKIGDVFAYKFKDEPLKDKYIFFLKIDEGIWHPGHIIPVIYVYWIISDKILTLKELNELSFIPQFYVPNVYKNNPNKKILYRLSVIETSPRTIPKKQLTFLGNLCSVNNIENEDSYQYAVNWKNFENYILDNFNDWKTEQDNFFFHTI